MAHDKPKGKELIAARAIEKLSVQIREEQDHLSHLAGQFLDDLGQDVNGETLDWGVDPGHMLSGTRINGIQTLTCLVDFVLGAKRIRSTLDSTQAGIIKSMVKLERLLVQLETITAKFPVCPACKGAKGKKVRREDEHSQHVTLWDDCETCNGRGLQLENC